MITNQYYLILNKNSKYIIEINNYLFSYIYVFFKKEEIDLDV
jgi:hypothetical protein